MVSMHTTRKKFIDSFHEGQFPDFMEETLETIHKLMEANRKSTFKLTITIHPFESQEKRHGKHEAEEC